MDFVGSMHQQLHQKYLKESSDEMEFSRTETKKPAESVPKLTDWDFGILPLFETADSLMVFFQNRATKKATHCDLSHRRKNKLIIVFSRFRRVHGMRDTSLTSSPCN